MSVSSTIPSRARISIIGDSVTSGNGGAGGAVNWCSPLGGLLLPLFTENGAAKGAPIYFIRGVAGDPIRSLTPRVATDVAPFYPNFVIVQAGTNDGTSGRTQAEANTDTLALIDAILAVPSVQGLIVMGPAIVGDVRPNGVNTYDAGLNNVNVGMAQACATRGVQFVNIRDKIFADLPTLNPGNTYGASGLMIANGTDFSCKHPSPTGAAYMSAYMASQLPNAA